MPCTSLLYPLGSGATVKTTVDISSSAAFCGADRQVHTQTSVLDRTMISEIIHLPEISPSGRIARTMARCPCD